MKSRRGQPRRKVAFVGNRTLVYDAVSEYEQLEVGWTWALRGSLLAAELGQRGLSYRDFGAGDMATLARELAETPFDILISNGCPIRIPIGELRRPGRVFVNVHPSPLPDLRGMHPINGALLFGRTEAGATMHYMSEEIDGGRLIAQRRIEVTDEMDLGLLYHAVFALEPRVFHEGMDRLIESGFAYAGEDQAGEASSYTRRRSDMEVDLACMDDDEILRRVRAFGIRTQGAVCTLNGRQVRILGARPVRHPALLAEFETIPPGSLALAYDGKLLVRTRQGLLSLTPIEESTSCA
jgi:methionyl-tRNA formyltransferase